MPVATIRCVCGCYIGKYYLKKHQKTQKHLKLMENLPPSTIEEVKKKMEELDEKIDEISSGEYLILSNRLKSIYDRLKRTDYNASLRVN